MCMRGSTVSVGIQYLIPSRLRVGFHTRVLSCSRKRVFACVWGGRCHPVLQAVTNAVPRTPRAPASPCMSAFHGGQEWQALPKFVEDLSVTTNGLGPPESALTAAREAVSTASHYPPASFEPHLSELAHFLWGSDSAKARLLLGNGASELIDLLVRDAALEVGKAPRGWR